MWSSTKHVKIRMAVVSALYDIMKYSKKRFPLEYFVDSLNNIVGKKITDHTSTFTATHIKNAFRHNGNDSLIRCSDITGDDDIGGIIYIRWGRMGRPHRNKSLSPQQYILYDFCLFPSMEEAIKGQKLAKSARIAPPTLFQTTIHNNVVSSELKDSLVELLKRESKEL
jgi:hypothetical protein